MEPDRLEYFTRKLKKIPVYPRLNPPYRVHWNWDISYRCNYKCSYCEIVKRDSEFIYKNRDAGMWKDVFDRLFEMYWSGHVRFSGGEPTIYPGFFEILGAIMEKNTADITTNLSFDMKDFLEKVPPGKGLSVSCSFHPEHDELEKFLKKAVYLLHNGYPSNITIVGYPPFLSEIPEYKRTIDGEGMIVKIMPFRGEYGGKQYPAAYTAQERAFLKEEALNSGKKDSNAVNIGLYEHSVEPKAPGEGIRKEKLCCMGQTYAVIHPDLEVTRCCAGYHGKESGVLGLITDPGFRLLDYPAACEAPFECPCFKAMLAGSETGWLPFWETLEHPEYSIRDMEEYVKYKTGGNL